MRCLAHADAITAVVHSERLSRPSTAISAPHLPRAAIEPPREVHHHVHVDLRGLAPEDVAAILRQLRGDGPGDRTPPV